MFPHFWHGPVWLQPHGDDPNATCIVDLVWLPWRRKQLVRSACAITTRKASVGNHPLHVTVPAGWALIAGIGLLPGAWDINAGWYLASVTAALSVVRENMTRIREGTARGD